MQPSKMKLLSTAVALALYGGSSALAEIKDTYIRYTGYPVKITVGQFKQPFGLEELTSSKYVTGEPEPPLCLPWYGNSAQPGVKGPNSEHNTCGSAAFPLIGAAWHSCCFARPGA